MAKSRSVLVELEETEFGFDGKAVADQLHDLSGFVSIHSVGLQKARLILLYESRTTLTSQHFKAYCGSSVVSACGELQPRLEEFADLVLRQCYKPFASGSLVIPWRETLGQAVDGRSNLFIITIPHFDPELEEVARGIDDLLRPEGLEVSGVLASKEHHFSGDRHVHLLVKTSAPYRFKLPELWAKVGAQGDIQRVVDEERVKDYILKKYQEGSKDFYACGIYSLPSYESAKVGGNEVLDYLVQEIITKKTNPWKFLQDKSKLVRLTAFRNRKSLEQLWYDSQRVPLTEIVPLVMPKKPKLAPFIRIWEWLNALRTHEIRSPIIPNRHLFISGATATRKSNFASFLVKSFRCFHFDVHDPYFDGYCDGFDLGICDEFNVMKPTQGKDLVNLNRFLEGAAGQLLNVKYQKVTKTDTTLPCVFISNLSEKALVDAAIQVFDVEIVKAFLRRFTFVDIGKTPFPDDFTVIGATVRSCSVSIQTDEVYYPPFQFSTITPFKNVTNTNYLAVPLQSVKIEQFTSQLRLAKEFLDPDKWQDTEYMIVYKNKGAKAYGPQQYNIGKEHLDCGILDTVVEGLHLKTSCGVFSANCKPGVEINTTLFPMTQTIKVAVVEASKDSLHSTWLDYYRFYVSLDKYGNTILTPSPEFIIHDIWISTNVATASTSPLVSTMAGSMAALVKLVGQGLRLVKGVRDCCSICMESTQAPGFVLACSHAFHNDCFMDLLQSSEFKCPNCRATPEELAQMNELYIGLRKQCSNPNCDECSDPLLQEQGVIGCACEHCISERLKSKQLVITNG